jgi:hypothetical protein
MARRRPITWVADHLEAALERAVELVGLGDDWHHPSCGYAWTAGSNHCRRYCRNQSGHRPNHQ